MKSLGAEDHPRLRGEQTRSPALKTTPLGSPPLARGTVGRNHDFVLPHGITPACAGNRQPQAGRGAGSQDHPRLRGEQAFVRMRIDGEVGSPPLARGTAISELGYVSGVGITPACAGNSTSVPLPVCAIAGSPPLARGTARSLRRRHIPRGITPACAGNRTLHRV